MSRTLAVRPKSGTPRAVDPAAYQAVPRPVAAMPKSFAAGHVIARHAHPRAQLLFAVRGTMAVQTGLQAWVIPPNRALWIPGGLSHEVRMIGEVDMRTLYIEPASSAALGPHCLALDVTPLARELIVRATALPVLYDDAGTDGLVFRLLMAELQQLQVLPLSLPLPQDAALAARCEVWLADIARMPQADACARELGISARTLARRFHGETGLSFGQWRQQARLLEAIRRRSQGESITDIALDLGYESTSAFSAMFRKATGGTPSQLLPQHNS